MQSQRAKVREYGEKLQASQAARETQQQMQVSSLAFIDFCLQLHTGTLDQRAAYSSQACLLEPADLSACTLHAAALPHLPLMLT